ncbi:uncharacterized protein DNG_01938 [Cephalotrichum gorgonifer]|uniref:Kynurenine formamidase n=1 Tax=Cephalotrichum gorgonifer TaxID=2041049 RepID=A0AAE8MRY9_9PEZI|nr:uncharacterized protein DNG_01938 [Cephalotrichum gorgonifer]
MSDSCVFTLHQYGEHELQRLATWEPREPPSDPDARWIIFIHGGAWRDPSNTYQDFAPTIDALLSSPSSGSSPPPAVRGFASLDYRLAPHPNHPQDPATTPPHKLRRAAHPDPIRDVRAALALLDAKYGIGDRYVLAGHSVGATLAFQALAPPDTPAATTRDGEEEKEEDVPPLPAAILGVAGIYEFHDFALRNGPAYVEMVEGALGTDRSKWNDAAPLHFRGGYAADWPCGRHVLLSYSPGDSLVDGAVETNAMVDRLRKDGCAVSTTLIQGEHDFAWQDGKQIASLVAELCQKL